MPKIDLKKELKQFYVASARDVVQVDVLVNDDRTKWQWTMMIHQPPCANDAVLRDALAALDALLSPASTMKSI